MSFSEHWSLPYVYERPLPDFQKHDDIKFPESLARAFIARYTDAHANVFDPFTGLGTTLLVAEEMGRTPYGTEADQQRHAWVQNNLQHKANLFLDDAYNAPQHAIPAIDLCLTSPPYMPRGDSFNPLFNGDPLHAGYTNYLERLQSIFLNIGHMMKPNGHIVVQADNLHGLAFSPLVWDIGNALSNVLRLEGEILITWPKNTENPNPFTHCLVFRPR